jgi:nucleoside-diphosphate-sugar epimerase
VDDIARGTIAALKPLGYEIINLGGHEVISINQLVEIVEDLTGKKANVQYGPPNLADMFTNQADVSKARDCSAGIRRSICVRDLAISSTGITPNVNGRRKF